MLRQQRPLFNALNTKTQSAPRKHGKSTIMNITRRSPVFLETLSFSSRKAWRKTKMEGLASFVGAYTNPYEDCLEALMEEFAAKKREHIAKHTYVSLYDKLTKFAKIKSQCDGDRRLKQLKETLDKFQWARTKDQFLFHEDFIRICLPHIYGPQEFEANRIRLMDAFGLQSMKVFLFETLFQKWWVGRCIDSLSTAMGQDRCGGDVHRCHDDRLRRHYDCHILGWSTRIERSDDPRCQVCL